MALREIPGRNRKTQLPGARGTFGGETCLPRKFLPEIAQLFSLLHFGRPDPHGREIAKNTGVFRPFSPRTALGTQRNSGSKTEKHNFPELGALLGGQSVRPKSLSMNLRNFFTFCVLANRTATGGKSQNTGSLGPFSVGQAAKDRNFPEQHFWGENPSTPQVSLRNCATFLPFAFWPTGPPRAGNRKVQGLKALLA